ncbi:hypothetical protein T265_06410 [Opisthorchis viverrini]|uniref:Tumour suppressor p53-binding protein-1 Tudor domain-containing protein n=1 Tax=Opisthorchis viverrini TaxID=6198 RepID=A0A075ADU6_OPIVI|nr:hypothetical protein T265_06410 [Opisthorchis viverrini]KER26289.1 hypothetical protein T265_06410 [Opisthorchis viverrini]
MSTPSSQSDFQNKPVFLRGITTESLASNANVLVGRQNVFILIYWHYLHTFLVVLALMEIDSTNSAECRDQLLDRMYGLWAQWDHFVRSALQLSSSQNLTDTDHLPSSTSKHAKSASSHPSNGLLRSKPLLPAAAVGTTARTSSSSSDLFVPRSQRSRAGCHFGRILPLLPATARSSTSSSDLFLPRMPRVRQLAESNNKSDTVSSPSAPESSPPVTGASVISSDTPQPPEVTDSGPKQTSLLSSNTGLVSKMSTVPETKLTLVPESPAEDTEDQEVISRPPPIVVPESTSSSASVASHFSSSASEEAAERTMVASTASHSAVTSATISAVGTQIALSSDEAPTTGKIPIYGRWHRQLYYYAGILELPQPGFRRSVQFEDGSQSRLKPSDLLYVNLLPVSAEVCADWDNNGDFWGDCVVETHLMDSRRPYLIFCRTNGERKAMARKDVTIHHSQVCRLRESGLLPVSADAAPERPGASSSTKNQPPSKRKTPRPEEQLSQPSGALLATPEVSLTNVLFSKRQPKVKRYRSSWATPLTRLAAEAKAKEGGYSSEGPKYQKLSKSFTTTSSLRSPTVDRDSTTSGRCKRLRQRSGRSETTNASGTKKQRLLKSPLHNVLSPLKSNDYESDVATPPIQPISRTSVDSSTTTATRPINDTSMLIHRRSLSRCLGIPVPSARLFCGWKIMITGRVTVLNAPVEYYPLSCIGIFICRFAVPIRYRFPAYQVLPPLSLFDLRVDWLGGQNKCELVAIVTDDMEVFGPAWANILQLANGAPLSSDELSSHVVKPIPILSTDEAPKNLHHLLYPMRSRSTPQRSVNKGSLVLIDVADYEAATCCILRRRCLSLINVDSRCLGLMQGCDALHIEGALSIWSTSSGAESLRRFRAFSGCFQEADFPDTLRNFRPNAWLNLTCCLASWSLATTSSSLSFVAIFLTRLTLQPLYPQDTNQHH